MTDEFDIPGDLDTGSVPPPPAGPPLVVVEYRYRGLPTSLMFVVVLVAVALGAMLYPRRTAPAHLVARQRTVPPSSKDARPAQSPRSAPTLTEEPLVLNGQGTVPLIEPTLPPPAPPPVAERPGDAVVASEAPVKPPAADPDEMPAPPARERLADRLFDVPPAMDGPALPDPAPASADVATAEGGTFSVAPEPPPTDSAQVERDIEREAEQRQAELDLMKEAKRDAVVRDRVEDAQRSYDQRLTFLRELHAIVRRGGADAGKQIDTLCDQYGRELATDHRKAVARGLKLLPERATQRDRIALLRRFDVPEPTILDYLAHGLHRKWMNARGGLRTADEVRVLAAKVLLAAPLAATPRGALPAAQPSR